MSELSYKMDVDQFSSIETIPLVWKLDELNIGGSLKVVIVLQNDSCVAVQKYDMNSSA